jgi:hypothetical protein
MEWLAAEPPVLRGQGQSTSKDIPPSPVPTSVSNSTTLLVPSQLAGPEFDAKRKAGDPEWLPVPASASFNF